MELAVQVPCLLKCETRPYLKISGSPFLEKELAVQVPCLLKCETRPYLKISGSPFLEKSIFPMARKTCVSGTFFSEMARNQGNSGTGLFSRARISLFWHKSVPFLPDSGTENKRARKSVDSISTPLSGYAKMISALTISVALLSMLFIFCTHSIWFSALSCSVTPSCSASAVTARK